MYCGKFEAARKFWETPVLVNKLLLPYLDLESTLHLAQVHELTRDILQGSIAWNKLIRRTRLQEGGALHRNPGLLEEKMEVVRHLVDILKLMKNRKANMLDLLDTICNKRFEGAHAGRVTLSCPNHPDSHRPDLFGDFLLLEAIEGAFGTSEQKAISSADFYELREPALSALSSRLARQQEKLTRLWFVCLQVDTKESAEAFKTLMEATSEVTMHEEDCGIEVLRAIGGEGWKALAEGVRLHPGVRPTFVTVLKDDLDEASKEDIRVVWDALKTDGHFSVVDPSQLDGQTVRKEEEGEDGWTRLTEVMEMSKEEWAAQVEAQDEDDGEAAEEGEGEDADGQVQLPREARLHPVVLHLRLSPLIQLPLPLLHRLQHPPPLFRGCRRREQHRWNRRRRRWSRQGSRRGSN